MLRGILLGLDGSPTSESAVALGIHWAKAHDALLVGIGIIDEPAIGKPEPVPMGAAVYKIRRDTEQMHEARVKVEQLLERFALRCSDASVACKVLENVGAPSDQIILEAQRFDLILMGKESHFQFETQDQPDHTLRRIIKHAPRPVVAVPETLPDGETALVAYDGSVQAARALFAFWASGLANERPVRLVSVHRDHDKAFARADRGLRFLRSHGIEAVSHLETSDRAPADVLMDIAAEVNAGLIVAGAFGQPGLREFFLGSVTRSLLPNARVPLFLTH